MFFTEEINKITWSSNNDKIMQLIDSIERYAYGTSEDLVSEKEEIKCNNIIKWYKNWPEISDYPYKILIIGGSGSGKTNSLFMLISQQPDIDKLYLCAKFNFEVKH